MQLLYFTLSKKQFDAIPEPDRALIVLMGHAANELNILHKLFYFCTTQEEKDSLLIQAQNAQAMTAVRVMAGKTFECWQLLRTTFFNGISKIYEPQFNDKANKSLDSLKQYFRRKNHIKLVRNNFAFHYSHKQISTGYKSVTEGDKLDVYISQKTNGNSLYAFAETIVMRSMLESINTDDHFHALETLAEEISEVIKWFNIVIAACISTCLKMYVGEDPEKVSARMIEIEGAPNLDSVKIPYFIEITEGREAG